MVSTNTGINTTELDHRNGGHQCFRRWGESLLPLASLEVIARLVSGSSSPMVNVLSVWCFLAGFQFE